MVKVKRKSKKQVRAKNKGKTAKSRFKKKKSRTANREINRARKLDLGKAIGIKFQPLIKAYDNFIKKRKTDESVQAKFGVKGRARQIKEEQKELKENERRLQEAEEKRFPMLENDYLFLFIFSGRAAE